MLWRNSCSSPHAFTTRMSRRDRCCSELMLSAFTTSFTVFYLIRGRLIKTAFDYALNRELATGHAGNMETVGAQTVRLCSELHGSSSLSIYSYVHTFSSEHLYYTRSTMFFDRYLHCAKLWHRAKKASSNVIISFVARYQRWGNVFRYDWPGQSEHLIAGLGDLPSTMLLRESQRDELICRMLALQAAAREV